MDIGCFPGRINVGLEAHANTCAWGDKAIIVENNVHNLSQKMQLDSAASFLAVLYSIPAVKRVIGPNRDSLYAAVRRQMHAIRQKKRRH